MFLINKEYKYKDLHFFYSNNKGYSLNLFKLINTRINIEPSINLQFENKGLNKLTINFVISNNKNLSDNILSLTKNAYNSVFQYGNTIEIIKSQFNKVEMISFDVNFNILFLKTFCKALFSLLKINSYNFHLISDGLETITTTNTSNYEKIEFDLSKISTNNENVTGHQLSLINSLTKNIIPETIDNSDNDSSQDDEDINGIF